MLVVRAGEDVIAQVAIDAIGIQQTTESAGGPPWLSIVLASISAVTMIVTAWFAYKAATNSRTVKSRIDSLDKSVNGVPEGTLPLVQRVGIVERRVDSHARWMTSALERIADQLGVSLPDRRDYDPEEGSP